jgi:hypothetical protein
MTFEIIAKIEDMMIYTNRVGSPTGIEHIADRTAALVGRPAPKLHRDADDLMTSLEHHGSGHRRIHAARHCHHYLHYNDLTQTQRATSARTRG